MVPLDFAEEVEIAKECKWLQKKAGYTVWGRNNLLMLHTALACGVIQTTLFALRMVKVEMDRVVPNT